MDKTIFDFIRKRAHEAVNAVGDANDSLEVIIRHADDALKHVTGVHDADAQRELLSLLSALKDAYSTVHAVEEKLCDVEARIEKTGSA